MSAATASNNVTLLPGSGQGPLTTPAGAELPVRTFERGEEGMLQVGGRRRADLLHATPPPQAPCVPPGS